MKQYVQTDLEADREVANTLANLIVGGLLGAGPGDSLDDLFPGSGAISRAWAAYTGQPASSPPAALPVV